MYDRLDKIASDIEMRVRRKLAEELRNVPCETTGGCLGLDLCASRCADDVAKLRDAGAVRFGSGVGIGAVRADLAPLIDHTLLKPDATKDDLKKLCEEARQYGFASVCVNSANVRACKEHLRGTRVMTVAVVGFPLGAMLPSAKAFETREAVRNGADEIDMVIHVGALKSRDYETVLGDIQGVVEAAKPRPVKVILETGSLTHDEKVMGCTLSKAAGAAFVKTSTGFGAGGATADDIALMRRVVGAEMGVKASGGVRTVEDADAMVKAGATRIGASASVAIVTGEAGEGDAKRGAVAGKY